VKTSEHKHRGYVSIYTIILPNGTYMMDEDIPNFYTDEKDAQSVAESEGGRIHIAEIPELSLEVASDFVTLESEAAYIEHFKEQKTREESTPNDFFLPTSKEDGFVHFSNLQDHIRIVCVDCTHEDRDEGVVNHLLQSMAACKWVIWTVDEKTIVAFPIEKEYTQR